MILGIDPSLTSTGWCLMSKHNGEWLVLKTGAIKTKRENKKRGIYVADDDTRRVRDIFRALTDLVIAHGIEVVVAEMPHGGAQSAVSAKGLAFATAIVACVVEAHSLALVAVTAQDSKKHLCGKRDASKIEMQQAIAKKYPALGTEYYSAQAKKTGFRGEFEDIADSIAAVLCAEREPSVVMAG